MSMLFADCIAPRSPKVKQITGHTTAKRRYSIKEGPEVKDNWERKSAVTVGNLVSVTFSAYQIINIKNIFFILKYIIVSAGLRGSSQTLYVLRSHYLSKSKVTSLKVRFMFINNNNNKKHESVKKWSFTKIWQVYACIEDKTFDVLLWK